MANNEVYNLRWNDYQSTLTSSVGTLLDDSDFIDVTLACEGQSFSAHKVVLSSCSGYLKKLLKRNPCQHPIVILKDVRAGVLNSLVHFMYHGAVDVPEDQLSDFLSAAQSLEVKGLAEDEAPGFQDRKSQPRQDSAPPPKRTRVLNMGGSSRSHLSSPRNTSVISAERARSMVQSGAFSDVSRSSRGNVPSSRDSVDGSDVLEKFHSGEVSITPAGGGSNRRDEPIIGGLESTSNDDQRDDDSRDVQVKQEEYESDLEIVEQDGSGMKPEGADNSMMSTASDDYSTSFAGQLPLDYPSEDSPGTSQVAQSMAMMEGATSERGASKQRKPRKRWQVKLKKTKSASRKAKGTTKRKNAASYAALKIVSKAKSTATKNGRGSSSAAVKERRNNATCLDTPKPVRPPKYHTNFCKYCNLDHKSPADLRRHIARKHEIRPMEEWDKCPFCNKIFKVEQDYRKHLSKMHGMLSPKKLTLEQHDTDALTKSKGKKLALQQHDAKTSTKSKGKKRTALSNPAKGRAVHGKAHICKYCGAQHAGSYKLKRHIERIHETRPVEEWDKCPHCESKFKALEYLKGHMKRIHGVSPQKTGMPRPKTETNPPESEQNGEEHQEIEVEDSLHEMGFEIKQEPVSEDEDGLVNVLCEIEME